MNDKEIIELYYRVVNDDFAIKDVEPSENEDKKEKEEDKEEVNDGSNKRNDKRRKKLFER